MAAGSMVVDRNDRVVVHFAEGSDGIVVSLLHLGVGPLDCVEFYLVAVLPCIYAAYSSASHSYAVVVAAKQYKLVTFLRNLLGCVGFLCVSNSAGQHYDLVVSELRIVFLNTLLLFGMFKGEQGSADNGLAEFVSEVAGSVGSLCQYFFRALIQPLARLVLLPWPEDRCGSTSVKSRVAGHVNRSSCNRETSLSAGHAVSDFSAGSCCGTVERLYRSREVVGFSLEADNGFSFLGLEKRRFFSLFRKEHLDLRPLKESAVVFVRAYNQVGIEFCGLLDHLEQRRFHLFAVYDEGSVENLVAAVLAVDLAEAEHLAVCKRTADLPGQTFQVGDFLLAQGQSLLLVIGCEVLYVYNLVRLLVNGKYILVQSFVKPLEHLVIHRNQCTFRTSALDPGTLNRSFFSASAFVNGREVLLHPFNAGNVHVLGNLHGSCAPWSYHFPARTGEVSFDSLSLYQGSLAQEPFKCIDVIVRELF